MRKPYVAKFSELSGPMNPTGIINARYLNLVSALRRGDHPDNVKQALFDWLSGKGPSQRPALSQAEVEAFLELEPEAAVTGLLQKISGKLVSPSGQIDHLPAQVVQTLRRALQAISKDVLKREGQGIASKIAGLRQMKQRYAAETLADSLLAR